MEIISTSLYQIDHSENLAKKISSVVNASEQLAIYVQKLFADISATNDKRKFYFRSETTEVRKSLDLMLSGKFENGTEINAKRLLATEIRAQEKINLDIEIQKGTLFQALVKDGSNKKVIISKADHDEFLDEADFELHTGLPWKKRVFKAIVISFNSDSSINSVFVYDTNYIMSKYWWQDFLELQEEYTDIYNTQRALELLDRKIFQPLERKYPVDHIVLRNMMVGYFRTEEEFNIERFAEKLEKYQPVDSDMPVEKIHKQTLDLPEKWNFDTRFSIEKKSINKRAKKRIKLNDGIEIVLDYVENLADVISTETDDEGNKYIRVRATEESYRYFQKIKK